MLGRARLYRVGLEPALQADRLAEHQPAESPATPRKPASSARPAAAVTHIASAGNTIGFAAGIGDALTGLAHLAFAAAAASNPAHFAALSAGGFTGVGTGRAVNALVVAVAGFIGGATAKVAATIAGVALTAGATGHAIGIVHTRAGIANLALTARAAGLTAHLTALRPHAAAGVVARAFVHAGAIAVAHLAGRAFADATATVVVVALP